MLTYCFTIYIKKRNIIHIYQCTLLYQLQMEAMEADALVKDLKTKHRKKLKEVSKNTEFVNLSNFDPYAKS